MRARAAIGAERGALRLLGPLQMLCVRAAADTSAAFNVRGSTTEDVALVLDGLELYDPFHLQAFQSPFSLVDSNVVDRIDFFGGGYTADLGDRHGGFVKISTLAPAGPAAAQIELGTLNSRASYRAPIADGSGAWLVAVRGWYPEALQDTIVSVLMSPHFCYRLDLAASAEGRRPLSDSELASRLSYFLWSSMPDTQLLERAAAGKRSSPRVAAPRPG